MSTFNRETKFTVKMSKTGNLLSPQSPITVKNQFREYQINSLEDLPDVDEVSVVTGATPVYNQSTDKYEIRQITGGDIDGPIDGGEF